MSVSEALDFIHDGDTVASSAAGWVAWPEYIVQALEDRFIERKSPNNLTIFSGCGHPDDHFAHPGFLKAAIGSHPDPSPKLRDMIQNNEFLAWVLPQGVLQQLYRCTAAKQPGLLTKIGAHTYIDPRQDGGKMNEITTDDIVRLMEIDGEEYLFFKSFPMDIGIVRGTTADEFGNVSIEHEPIKLEILEIALAVKSSGGHVIVQVERVAKGGSLKAKDIVIPGELVDAVVVAENPEVTHRQSPNTMYNPYFSGELKSVKTTTVSVKEKLEADDIVCRRAVFELFRGAVINIGVGIGTGVGQIAADEGISDEITSTSELGVFGGVPQGRGDFPSTIDPVSFVSHTTMFDYYHGNNLDMAFLGAAQIDQEGNVNVSRYNNRPAGQGGFIDISQSTKKVVFCTYFVAGGMKTTVTDGKIRIDQEGKFPKFVDRVDQITFNGKMAAAAGKEVLYCTERALFRLTPEGLELIEIAPGIDLEKDILPNMGFAPIVSENLKVMDGRIFVPGRMGCFDR
jgi:propionate CoA-transferase